MLLALTIIMSFSLASRMFVHIFKEAHAGNPIAVISTIMIDGGVYQPILWILYAHT
jgi:hypothetical protein